MLAAMVRHRCGSVPHYGEWQSVGGHLPILFRYQDLNIPQKREIVCESGVLSQKNERNFLLSIQLNKGKPF